MPKDIQKIRERLIAEGKIDMQTRKEKCDPVIYMNLEQPDISHFPDNHISVLDSLIDEICSEYSANEISRVSHDDIWKAIRRC